MRQLILKLKLECADRIRYTKFARLIAGLLRFGRAVLTCDLNRRLERLEEAYRALLPTAYPQLVEKPLRRFVEDPVASSIWRDRKIGWNPLDPQCHTKSISKGLVLKPWVGPQEKGVIFISFEYNLYPLLNSPNLPQLLQRYSIVCAPSWSPPSFRLVWSMAHFPNADISFTISNKSDQEWLMRLNSGVAILPLLVSHWVNPENFQPKSRHKRTIDILMVANWAPFKRHWVLFKALKKMRRDLRVVLVGQPDSGRTVEDVMREADYFGVRQRVEFRDRLTISEVNSLQCDSKVSLVFSRREGSCVVVAESLFADAPVGLLKGAHIGSSAFINSQTGRFLDEDQMSRQLTDFLDESDQFRARDWAIKNIDCHSSSNQLNGLLCERALRSGQNWTKNIASMCCYPNPLYVNPDDAVHMSLAYEELERDSELSFLQYPVKTK